jgi:hypothetical protein
VSSRADVIAYARTLAGLSADPGCLATRAQYLEVIAPGETTARKVELAAMSGCALVQRGVLRHFIDHPLLERSYVDQHAMSDLLAIAREADAAHGADRDPLAGDIMIVSEPEHTLMVLDICVDPYAHVDPCELLTCLDGGHRDEKTGYQSVIVRDHELQGGWDEAGGLRRRVVWVLDLEAILARFGR